MYFRVDLSKVLWIVRKTSKKNLVPYQIKHKDSSSRAQRRALFYTQANKQKKNKERPIANIIQTELEILPKIQQKNNGFYFYILVACLRFPFSYSPSG